MSCTALLTSSSHAANLPHCCLYLLVCFLGWLFRWYIGSGIAGCVSQVCCCCIVSGGTLRSGAASSGACMSDAIAGLFLLFCCTVLLPVALVFLFPCPLMLLVGIQLMGFGVHEGCHVLHLPLCLVHKWWALMMLLETRWVYLPCILFLSLWSKFGSIGMHVVWVLHTILWWHGGSMLSCYLVFCGLVLWFLVALWVFCWSHSFHGLVPMQRGWDWS